MTPNRRAGVDVMMTASPQQSVYFAAGITDRRKSIDSLAALVQSTFRLDPCSCQQQCESPQ